MTSQVKTSWAGPRLARGYPATRRNSLVLTRLTRPYLTNPTATSPTICRLSALTLSIVSSSVCQ